MIPPMNARLAHSVVSSSEHGCFGFHLPHVTIVIGAALPGHPAKSQGAQSEHRKISFTGHPASPGISSDILVDKDI